MVVVRKGITIVGNDVVFIYIIIVVVIYSVYVKLADKPLPFFLMSKWIHLQATPSNLPSSVNA